MSTILFYFRIGLEILAVIYSTVSGLIIYFLPNKVRIAIGKRVLQFWAKLSCWIFGIRVTIHGERKKVGPGTLVIANHVTYWDIFALGSLFPTVFLSKIEVRHIPVLGTGAWAVGVLFVDRSSARSGAKSIRDITTALKNGSTLISFPEGTTTDEEKLREFKIGIFQAVVKDDIPIQPIAITYEDFKTEGWGKQGMGEHMRQTVPKLRHQAHVIFGEPIYGNGKDPRQVRQECQDVMSELYEQVLFAKNGAQTPEAIAKSQAV